MVERRSGLLSALAVVVLAIVAMAVTLPGLEFSNGGESIVVTTALETRRTGKWLIPTMNNRPRVTKPPLPMWLSAAFISNETMASLGSSDRDMRERALATLNWQVRWPALLASGLTLLVVYELGRTLSGRSETVGWMAAAICASQLLFLRYGRLATTDVQIMLWVAVANLCIAKMLFEDRRWGMAIGAGVAMGLGLMCKGPVVLLQAITPVLAMIGWERWRGGGDSPRRSYVRPIAVALLVALMVAARWYLYVLDKVPGVAKQWWIEVMRQGAVEQSEDEWFGYLSLLPMLAPWTVFFIVGAVAAWRERRSPAGRGLVFAVLMVIVPILVMSCFSDRKSRYLLPMAIPAAVVAAQGVIACVAEVKVRWVVGVHWLIVAVPTIGFPIAAAVGISGQQWFGWPVAATAAGLAAVVIAITAVRGRSAAAIVGVTFGVMMALQVLFMHGYRNSDRGRSEMKPLADRIWASYPGAHVRMTGKRYLPVAPDLPLYLNRSVQWLPSLDRLVIGNEPCVLITRQRKNEPTPTPPPGWIALEPVRRDSTLWHAFVLMPGK